MMSILIITALVLGSPNHTADAPGGPTSPAPGFWTAEPITPFVQVHSVPDARLKHLVVPAKTEHQLYIPIEAAAAEPGKIEAPNQSSLHGPGAFRIRVSPLVRSVGASEGLQCERYGRGLYVFRPTNAAVGIATDKGPWVSLNVAPTASGEYPLAGMRDEVSAELAPTPGQGWKNVYWINAVDGEFKTPDAAVQSADDFSDEAESLNMDTGAAEIRSTPSSRYLSAPKEVQFEQCEDVRHLLLPQHQQKSRLSELSAIELPPPEKFAQCDDFSLLLDPGHNPAGKNRGAFASNFKREVHFNDRLTIDLLKQLKAYRKITTSLTRDPLTSRSLKQRSAIARKLKPDFFLSLHHDSIGWKRRRTDRDQGMLRSTCEEDRGFSIYINPLSPSVARSWTAAYGLSKNLRDSGRPIGRFFMWGDINSGIYTGETLHVLRRTKMPGMLFEAGFLCNKQEQKRIENPK